MIPTDITARIFTVWLSDNKFETFYTYFTEEELNNHAVLYLIEQYKSKYCIKEYNEECFEYIKKALEIYGIYHFKHINIPQHYKCDFNNFCFMLIKNPFKETAFNNYLFENTDEELQYIKQFSNNNIYTVSKYKNKYYMECGKKERNIERYFISHKPWYNNNIVELINYQ